MLTADEARRMFLPQLVSGDEKTGVIGTSNLMVDGELIFHLVASSGTAVPVANIPDEVLCELRTHYPWVDAHFTGSVENTAMLFKLCAESDYLMKKVQQNTREKEELRTQLATLRQKLVEQHWDSPDVRDAVQLENEAMTHELHALRVQVAEQETSEDLRRSRYASVGASLLELQRLNVTFSATLKGLVEHPDEAVRLTVITAYNFYLALQERIASCIEGLDLAGAVRDQDAAHVLPADA